MQWGCSPGNEARPGRLGADDFEDEIWVYLLVTDGYDLDFVDPHNWTAFQGHMVSLCTLYGILIKRTLETLFSMGLIVHITINTEPLPTHNL